MGDCSSKPAEAYPRAVDAQMSPSGKPSKGRRRGEGGASARVMQPRFGQPVAAPHQSATMTGEFDAELYKSLPPCPVAPAVKALGPHGQSILAALYRAIQDLYLHGRHRADKRSLQLSLIKRDPHAIAVAQYAGFSPDPGNLDHLTVGPGADYEKKLTRNEYGTLLQYIEAMLGGVPDSSVGLIY